MRIRFANSRLFGLEIHDSRSGLRKGRKEVEIEGHDFDRRAVPKIVLPDGTSGAAAALPPFCCVLCLCWARCCLLRISADPTCAGSPPPPSFALGTASAGLPPRGTGHCTTRCPWATAGGRGGSGGGGIEAGGGGGGGG